MSQYKVTPEELIDLARKIYDEACHGYLDLKEAACDKVVREFLDGRTVAQEFTYGTIPSPTPPGYVQPNYHVTIEPPYVPTNINYQTTISAGDITLPYTGEGIHIRQSSGHQLVFRDTDLGDEVRPDTFVRTDNFEGNESERF